MINSQHGNEGTKIEHTSLRNESQNAQMNNTASKNVTH